MRVKGRECGEVWVQKMGSFPARPIEGAGQTAALLRGGTQNQHAVPGPADPPRMVTFTVDGAECIEEAVCVYTSGPSTRAHSSNAISAPRVPTSERPSGNPSSLARGRLTSGLSPKARDAEQAHGLMAIGDLDQVGSRCS